MELPTIGRRVWFWNNSEVGVRDLKQAFDAGVVFVHPAKDGSDVSVVDLQVTDHYGVVTTERNVTLRDYKDDAHNSGRAYATWMPYQMKKSAADKAFDQPHHGHTPAQGEL